MRANLATIELVAAMFSASLALAGERDIPQWHKAARGTHAYLGDDGGGANTRTVCDTADRYRDWLDDERPSGCLSFQHDLPVVIEAVTFDPVKDMLPGSHAGLPIAKILIPSKKFSGYTHLLGLHPLIPPGTIIRFKKTGNETIELSTLAAADNSRTIDLGDQVSAKLVDYDPSIDDNYGLHVTILDGVHAGQSGWTLSLGMADDGSLVDQFSGAVISNSNGDETSNQKVRCSSVGVAKMIVTDMFNRNPGAQSLGLTAEEVHLGGELPDGSCVVEVDTNHGYVMKYKFRYDENGTATLDLLP